MHFVLSVAVTLKDEAKVLARLKPGVAAPFTFPKAPTLPKARFAASRPLSSGLDPAGLFAALTLARAGVQPILIERGKPVEERTKSVQMMQEQGILDPESNVQFGEGGAGAFSDGKLTTGTKSPLIRTVLQTFVDHGAPEDILYIAKPHVGTDLLKGVVRSMRQEIIQLGGQVRFDTRPDRVVMRGESMEGITVLCGGETQEIRTDTVILAIGHSARDTMQTLFRQGVRMEQKPFAMGVRIEHPQALISQSQYGKCWTRPRAEGGGLQARRPYARRPRNIHLLHVSRRRGDCGGKSAGRPVRQRHELPCARGRKREQCAAGGRASGGLWRRSPAGGLRVAAELSRRHSGLAAGGYKAPVQRVEDLLHDRATTRLGDVQPTYRPGVVPAELRACLPDFIIEDLKFGIRRMDGQLHGFAHRMRC